MYKINKHNLTFKGVEYVEFEKELPLEGKVESYMNDIINKMRSELRSVLDKSIRAYPAKPRDEW